MDTGILKKFAQNSRRQLQEQIAAQLVRVLSTDTAQLREQESAINDLRTQIKETSKEAVIERVAYTWFNRFCALRFMDINGYNPVRIVSPADGFTQAEVLAEAKQGYLPAEFFSRATDKQKINDLLSGKLPSSDPQNEAYRLILVAVCNFYHSMMPFLFEKIADYTELLMPLDLLSDNSILAAIREAISPENGKEVEVIGWLYQFYISEKKDKVFEDLKKNKKITPENIPAATQLFTPHWIVRYLVENSLGRLWMLNHPQSGLIEKMEYYIKPEQPETDFLKITSPTEIKVCDPACGSGHMLTYAFDLLYSIYEESGYDAPDIPQLILENNLYGIEIDERAGELAAFALIMKACEKDKRFLKRITQPNICVLENVTFNDTELKSYMDAMGRDLFTSALQDTLHQFEEVKNFGSLIKPVVTDVAYIRQMIESKNLDNDLFLYGTHEKVLKVLQQTDYLSPKYHVTIANPPYMGGKGMNDRLKVFAQKNFPDSKSDLFAMFMEQSLYLCQSSGIIGMINLPSWLFLSTFEKLRKKIISNFSISSLLHMGRGIFGIDWGSTAFIIQKQSINIRGSYFRLHKRNFQHIYFDDIKKLFLNAKRNHEYKYDFDEYRDKAGTIEIPEESNNSGLQIYFQSAANAFKKIPGSPIAYWVSDAFSNTFSIGLKIGSSAKKGLSCSGTELFYRYVWEVSNNRCFFNKGNIWHRITKGGPVRKWYGNNENLIKWENNGYDIKSRTDEKGKPLATIRNENFYLQPGVSWNDVSSGSLSCRYTSAGSIPTDSGPMIYSKNKLLEMLLFLNSCVSKPYVEILCPTIHFGIGQIAEFPLIAKTEINYNAKANALIALSKFDWDLYETSWDFADLSLLRAEYRRKSLEDTYRTVYKHWQDMTQEMQKLEEENNRVFIDAYGLQDELTPDVPLEEITLTCNPNYRYGKGKPDEEYKALLLADTMKEFISYSLGCMFGRYSLDKPGLILANQGETLKDYLAQIPTPTFVPDSDNVIPILDGDWFTDDVAERFKKFLKVTFGEEQYEENLKFIEDALGKDIRKYFLKDFYNDHLKRYKKRPIYWLFSSPNGSFNALIYMHRYRQDTVSIILNDYLREYRAKLAARKDHLSQVEVSASATPAEKTKAIKEIDKITKMIQELDAYEREVLYPLATEQIAIDLDDGVKVNYNKFGNALKKIAGMDAKEE